MTDTIDRLFHDFHLLQLPQKMSGSNGARVAALARELEPICVRLSDTDNAYTYRPLAHSIDIVAGTESKHLVQISTAQWKKMLDNDGELIAEIQSEYSDKNEASEFSERWQSVLTVMYAEI